jgi:hypothetical protein
LHSPQHRLLHTCVHRHVRAHTPARICVFARQSCVPSVVAVIVSAAAC